MAGPMEPIRGEETFNASPQKLFAALTSLDELSRNIPDLQTATKVDDRTLQCTVRPGFSFVRGTLKSTIRVVEATPNEAVKIGLSASGIGMGMEIEARLQIQPLEGGGKSKLVYEAQVMQRSGLVSAVPAGVITGAAEKTIKDGWERVRRHVEA
jgi:carbon monoxide dehydrogenase subunit G